MAGRAKVDAAIIDSNVLRIKLRFTPELRRQLRVVESWGPFPIQPVVIRSGLHPELKYRLREALLTIGGNSRTPPTLTEFGLKRFAPVTYEHYAPEEQALRECENALGTRLLR